MFPSQLFRKYLSVLLVFSGAVFLTCVILLTPVHLQASEIPELQKYIQNGSYGVSRDGTVLFSQNLHTRFIPASTIKLITSLAALEILGPDYRFSTTLFLDTESNLYIVGSGDPFLVSEKIDTIAGLVRKQGITKIRNIILDDSAFSLEGPTEGSGSSTNPYDAQCSALGVNFNTIPFRVFHNAKIQSSEAQTPYLPLMSKFARKLPNGTHRINLDSFPQQGHLPNGLLYTGQLFKALFQKHGITVTQDIKQGHVPESTPLLLHFIGDETTRDLIQATLLSSSNFMANQLFLAIGMKQYGPPATWEKGKKAMNLFIHNTLGMSKAQVTMVEGSGLSTNNRITAEAMLLILEKFRPHASLLPKKHGLLIKSGTLRQSGVFSYAGYLTQANRKNPFVILLNQKRNSRAAILSILSQQEYTTQSIH